MRRFIEHIPGFVDMGNGKPRIFEFKTIAELVENPIVRKFSEFSNFYRFSKDRHRLNRHYLMAEYNQGKEWFVVGYLEGLGIDLPRWEPKK